VSPDRLRDPRRFACTYTDDQFRAGVAAMLLHRDDVHTMELGGLEKVLLRAALAEMGFVERDGGPPPPPAVVHIARQKGH